MQPGFIDTCHSHTLSRPFLGFRHRSPLSPLSTSLAFLCNPRVPTSPSVSCSFSGGGKRRPQSEKQQGKGRKNGRGGEGVKVKEKENVWSIDNEVAAKAAAEEKIRKRRRGRRVKSMGKKGRNSSVLVSAAMLMEIETVLQTQEPVIRPAWDTFASSVSGIWTGVGAVFSPLTAEMEPIEIGNQNENLYDCYTLSRIEKEHSEVQCSQIHRKTNWMALNPFGEISQHSQRGYRIRDRDETLVSKKKVSDSIDQSLDLPSYESYDFETSEVLEEDFMGMEPGLVFFEDGSYSRGPVDLPVGDFDESKCILSPTYKFEQCLVKGCHKRLRIVHTIEFNEGGSDVQIIRVALYEEQWISPVNLYDRSDLQFDLKPFSQRKRSQPSELTGSWKVFEVSATPIFGEDTSQENVLPYVYLCTETLKKRSLPDNPAHFGEEEMLDMQDVTVLWLPGGITGYVDVSNDGILCIGVGWYSDEGINLVMERDYGMDGKLKEVRWKTEVKRRWADPFTV